MTGNVFMTMAENQLAVLCGLFRPYVSVQPFRWRETSLVSV